MYSNGTLPLLLMLDAPLDMPLDAPLDARRAHTLNKECGSIFYSTLTLFALNLSSNPNSIESLSLSVRMKLSESFKVKWNLRSGNPKL